MDNKQKRAVIKSCVTRLISFVISWQVGGNLNEIKVRKRLQSSLVYEYNDVKLQIEIDAPENGWQESERVAFNDLWLELEAIMETLLCIESPSPTLSINNEGVINSSMVNLPTISLPKFSGALQDFMHFYKQFVALFISNDEPTDIQRN
jgi:hypothetical protein